MEEEGKEDSEWEGGMEVSWEWKTKGKEWESGGRRQGERVDDID